MGMLQVLSPIFISRSNQAGKLGTHKKNLSKQTDELPLGKSLPFGESKLRAITYGIVISEHQEIIPQEPEYEPHGYVGLQVASNR